MFGLRKLEGLEAEGLIFLCLDYSFGNEELICPFQSIFPNLHLLFLPGFIKNLFWVSLFVSFNLNLNASVPFGFAKVS